MSINSEMVIIFPSQMYLSDNILEILDEDHDGWKPLLVTGIWVLRETIDVRE